MRRGHGGASFLVCSGGKIRGPAVPRLRSPRPDAVYFSGSFSVFRMPCRLVHRDQRTGDDCRARCRSGTPLLQPALHARPIQSPSPTNLARLRRHVSAHGNAAGGLFALVKSDLTAKAAWLYGASSARAIIKTLLTDGTLAMLLYRLMQVSQRYRLAPLAMLFNKLNVIFGGCVIGRGAQFGPGFVLVHSMGVVINTSVRGGRDVKIEHQVTIGAERGLSPVLGDDLFIGAGAKVLGAITIGSRVRIGANAVVVKDVPDDITAVGVPARYLPRRDDA